MKTHAQEAWWDVPVLRPWATPAACAASGFSGGDHVQALGASATASEKPLPWAFAKIWLVIMANTPQLWPILCLPGGCRAVCDLSPPTGPPLDLDSVVAVEVQISYAWHPAGEMAPAAHRIFYTCVANHKVITKKERNTQTNQREMQLSPCFFMVCMPLFLRALTSQCISWAVPTDHLHSI